MNLTLTEDKHLESTLSAMMPLYNEALKQIVQNDISTINAISSHLIGTHGKQFRPILTLLSAAAAGFPVPENSSHPLYRTAAAIQLLHDSTLIHDDVVDNSSLRRGKPTINSTWGNKVAVLAGDYFLSVVMQTITEINNQELTSVINSIVAEMAQGELLQLENTGNYMVDEMTYLTIIRKKTASFMAASCLSGAIVAKADPETKQLLQQYGLNLGLAFQIRDDIIDLLPSEKTGKPQGNDLHEHKTTLPVIFAIKNSTENNKKELITLLQKKILNDDNITRIISILHESNAIEFATDKMQHFLNIAKQTISQLPHNNYQNALIGLCKL